MQSKEEASRESAESVMLLLQQLNNIVPEKVDVKISCGSNCTSPLNMQIEYNKQELSVEFKSQLDLLWEEAEREEISFTFSTSMECGLFSELLVHLFFHMMKVLHHPVSPVSVVFEMNSQHQLIRAPPNQMKQLLRLSSILHLPLLAKHAPLLALTLSSSSSSSFSSSSSSSSSFNNHPLPHNFPATRTDLFEATTDLSFKFISLSFNSFVKSRLSFVFWFLLSLSSDVSVAFLLAPTLLPCDAAFNDEIPSSSKQPASLVINKVFEY
ncbi:uncharacterized protein MONOS_15903 [Monocercomonoides exilis]|uniref:uncharacterized protein n=1 Tax=Monocercomonoides exilis TaxID=2049356 RepID=UPI003559F77E|nr:hypothetical protein MONOS_15903 [Monocercomonoides exilis]|eukprot:MONOS_15903.1-p1 / transcript=MONOS_15903.1 / gene=MONOS_15903 / organism=Monocercomonoides_exilis_PA203 / gene_product=unspecified product / transcript_product=unspecified product / location=Mono_scaffold01398:5079-5882(-) / protein_length=268 / sequence_SO=supercontig / SO=protein_coding / is_pseudo=false